MDSVIAAAARALASGDALSALNYVALRNDAEALALRGVAMAQLNDFARAKLLLRRAARAFGPRAAVARARCAVAEAEVALVSRDLNGPVKPLQAAADALAESGDHANAAYARYLLIRRLLLIGRLDEAQRLVDAFDPEPLPSLCKAAYQLVLAGLALRRLRVKKAREALGQAQELARQSGVGALIAEVETAAQALAAPAARRVARGEDNVLTLDGVEAILRSPALVIDACRRVVAGSGPAINLQTRPVLFTLLRVLAEAWPGPASRAALLARAFRARAADESHRARLRVEIGRLRKLLEARAQVEATRTGFALVVADGAEVVILAPLIEETHADLQALLSDGEAWSSAGLALALGVSQRSAQRALDDLLIEGKVRAIAEGRARRWTTAASPNFPTALLLPVDLTSG